MEESHSQSHAHAIRKPWLAGGGEWVTKSVMGYSSERLHDSHFDSKTEYE